MYQTDADNIQSLRVIIFLIFFMIPMLVIVGAITIFIAVPTKELINDFPTRFVIGISISLISILFWIYKDKKMRKEINRLENERKIRWEIGNRDKCIHLPICKFKYTYICPDNCKYFKMQ